MTATVQARRALAGAGPDRILLISVAALLSGGIVMIYSASIANVAGGIGAAVETNYRHLLRQGVHLALGLALLLTAARIKLEWLQRAARALLLVGLASLVAVLVAGVEVNGSLRWLEVGGVRIQPSEAMKIAAVIYFADYFARKHGELHRFKIGVSNAGLVVGVICFLLLLEPDFGAATVIAASVAGMMFLAGVRFWHFVASAVLAGALMAALAWMEPYRVERILSFLNPFADAHNAGYQLAQALIAIGRGEWFGAGLGNSIQKLAYLPHASTDFLAAIIAEELGAAGLFAVLVLYAALLWRAFAIARRALAQGHRFAGLLAQGLGLLLALQAAIHIGVNAGILPTKGLTLPLMSYGGSSLLSCMAAVGLLFAADRHTRARLPKSPQSVKPGSAP